MLCENKILDLPRSWHLLHRKFPPELDEFDCGKEPLNRFLKHYALTNQKAESLRMNDHMNDHIEDRVVRYTCLLEKDKRGCYVKKIEDDWEIEGKFRIPKGSTFVLWETKSGRITILRVSLVMPERDIRTEAVELVNLFRVKVGKNRYYGTCKAKFLWGKRQIVSTEAHFTAFKNKTNFGFTIS